MPERLLMAAAELRRLLGDFHPPSWSPEHCAQVVRALSVTEHACAAARVRAAQVAIEGGVHRREGLATGADWLAQETGSTTSEAKGDLATASQLQKAPVAEAALVAGEISFSQAKEITASREDLPPGDEGELVEVAKGGNLGQLREAIRERVFQGSHPGELHLRQHQAREFRPWRDRLGMVAFGGALPPEVGLPFLNRLEAEADRLRKAAKASGAEVEAFSAYLADALVAMLGGQGKGHHQKAELVVVCDLRAFRRGHLHEGEVCHLIDGGPIPVEVAKELSKDAFWKAVITDGVTIHSVTHFGRHIPAALRTALELGSPPGFSGTQCVEANCTRRYGLEWDHIDPLHNHGPTSFDNLAPRCYPHHQEKTERDRKAGLLGPAPP